MKVVLASGSPYRKELLQRLLNEFVVQPSEADETPIQESDLSPENKVLELARLKAHALKRDHPSKIIIGSDQAPFLGETMLGKPGSKEKAVQQLKLLAGKTHSLLTSVVLVKGEKEIAFIHKAELKMRSLTVEEIDRYLAYDSPFNCAGSYKIESRGIALFDSVNTDDFTGIIGLPLLKLAHYLRELGLELP